MKRVREDSGGPNSKRGNFHLSKHCVKVLCPDALVTSLMGPRGSTKDQLQMETGTKLIFSNKNDYYPESKYRVLGVFSDDLARLGLMFERILPRIVEMGDQEREVTPSWARETAEFVGKEPGEYLFRICIAKKVSSALIGREGGAIKRLRAETGAKIFIDNNTYAGHQLVRIIGGQDSILRCLERINEVVAKERGSEEEYQAWAQRVNFSEGAPSVGKVWPVHNQEFETVEEYGDGMAGIEVAEEDNGGLGLDSEMLFDPAEFDSGDCAEDEEVYEEAPAESEGEDWPEVLEVPELPELPEPEEPEAQEWEDFQDPDQQIEEIVEPIEFEPPPESKGKGKSKGKEKGKGKDSGKGKASVVKAHAAGAGAVVSASAEAVQRLYEAIASLPPGTSALQYSISCELSANCATALEGNGDREMISGLESRTGTSVDLTAIEGEEAGAPRPMSVVGPLLNMYAAHFILIKEALDAERREIERREAEAAEAEAAAAAAAAAAEWTDDSGSWGDEPEALRAKIRELQEKLAQVENQGTAVLSGAGKAPGRGAGLKASAVKAPAVKAAAKTVSKGQFKGLAQGTPVKGTPVKGTPVKGTPVKGTPVKGLGKGPKGRK